MPPAGQVKVQDLEPEAQSESGFADIFYIICGGARRKESSMEINI